MNCIGTVQIHAQPASRILQDKELLFPEGSLGDRQPRVSSQGPGDRGSPPWIPHPPDAIRSPALELGRHCVKRHLFSPLAPNQRT
ncbi:hypothetical protein RA210_U250042 [Rubrivivax sp. A210]|nr:hypothetical protein RA210_U250042 [Rubrivivax sp. A210]